MKCMEIRDLWYRIHNEQLSSLLIMLAEYPLMLVLYTAATSMTSAYLERDE